MKFLNKKIVVLFLLILYKVLLDIHYLSIINPLYGYSGFQSGFTFTKFFITTFVVAIMAGPFHTYLKRITAVNVSMIVFNLIFFIPGMTYFCCSALNPHYFIYFSLYWLLLAIAVKVIKQPKIAFFDNDLSRRVFYFLLFFVVFSAVFITGYYNQFKLHFSFTDVYDLRAEVQGMNLPKIVGYIFPSLRIAIPVIIFYFFYKRNNLIAWLFVLVQLLLFAFGGHKSVLFQLPLLYFIYKFYRDKTQIALLLVLIGLVTISFVEYFQFDSYLISGYGIRRILFVPNQLSYLYFDYFSTHELLYLRESVLRWLGFDSPNSLLLNHLISNTYFDRIYGANQGITGDAFAQFGWLSLCIYPFLTVYVFRIFDACAKNISEILVAFIAASTSFIFISQSFFTALLTGGFLFICVFIYFYPREKVKSV